VDHQDRLEYANPEAVKKYLSKAREVTLSPEQSAKIDLELNEVRRINPILSAMVAALFLLTFFQQAGAPHAAPPVRPRLHVSNQRPFIDAIPDSLWLAPPLP